MLYKTYNHYQSEDQNATDYCDHNRYQLVFWTCNIYNILIVIIVVYTIVQLIKQHPECLGKIELKKWCDIAINKTKGIFTIIGDYLRLPINTKGQPATDEQECGQSVPDACKNNLKINAISSNDMELGPIMLHNMRRSERDKGISISQYLTWKNMDTEITYI